jgi:hypothetical protein
VGSVFFPQPVKIKIAAVTTAASRAREFFMCKIQLSYLPNIPLCSAKVEF